MRYLILILCFCMILGCAEKKPEYNQVFLRDDSEIVSYKTEFELNGKPIYGIGYIEKETR